MSWDEFDVLGLIAAAVAVFALTVVAGLSVIWFCF